VVILEAKFFLGPGGSAADAPVDKKLTSTERSFRFLPTLGLNAQELEFVQSVFLKPELAKKLGEIAEQNSLHLSIHGSYFVNFCSEEKEKRDASRKRILDACKIGELLGVKVVLFHPGARGKLSSQQCLELIVSECEKMAGETSVSIGLETAGKKKAWGTLEEVIEASALVKGCVPVIDWAHLYACNGGKIDYAAILDVLAKNKIKDLHCHFEGVEFTEAGEKRHIPLIHQQPPFAPLAAEIAKRKNDFETITLISESPELERDSLVMKKELEKAGVSL